MGTNLYFGRPDRFQIQDFDEIETRLVEVQGGSLKFEEGRRECTWCRWILEGGLCGTLRILYPS